MMKPTFSPHYCYRTCRYQDGRYDRQGIWPCGCYVEEQADYSYILKPCDKLPVEARTLATDMAHFRRAVNKVSRTFREYGERVLEGIGRYIAGGGRMLESEDLVTVRTYRTEGEAEQSWAKLHARCPEALVEPVDGPRGWAIRVPLQKLGSALGIMNEERIP